MLDALTEYQSFNYKFLPSRSYYSYPFAFENYDDFPLSKYAGRLLIVNLRNGNKSPAGEISGHWRPGIMQVSDYYTEALLPHLKENPDRFMELWSNNGIYVYRIF